MAAGFRGTMIDRLTGGLLTRSGHALRPLLLAYP